MPKFTHFTAIPREDLLCLALEGAGLPPFRSIEGLTKVYLAQLPCPETLDAQIESVKEAMLLALSQADGPGEFRVCSFFSEDLRATVLRLDFFQ